MTFSEPDLAMQTLRNRSAGGRRAAEAKKLRAKRLSAQERLEAAMAPARALQGGETHKVKSVAEIVARLGLRQAPPGEG